ncbi:hypothetical protein DFH07DRAFT_1065351 [Mycena maculata]|uniref:Uncharacterized protein n=1 Tax=Mycena maculata TaxID=230809 RepID=A0AAD7MUL7_9AGAR|nr:hypothetical protein DFH07DRAFT_1065351 [Mycena maculata]
MPVLIARRRRCFDTRHLRRRAACYLRCLWAWLDSFQGFLQDPLDPALPPFCNPAPLETTSPESPAINPTDATSPPPPRKGKAKIVFQYYHYNLEPPPKKPRRLRRMGLDGMVSYEYPQEPVKDLPGWFQSVPATPPASDNDNSWETKYLRGPGENFRGDNFRPYILRPKQTQ